MSEAARSRRDDARYEPTLAVPGRESLSRDSRSSDPLAELARLVGQDDPFRNVFRPAPAAAHPVSDNQRSYDGSAAESADPYHGRDAHHADHEGRDQHGYDGDHHYGEDDYESAEHGYDHHAQDGYAAESYAHADEAGLGEDYVAPGQAAAVLPDMWARGQDRAPVSTAAFDHGGPLSDRSEGRTSARRPLAVLAAVLLLTVGGLGASFLVKGSSSSHVAPAVSNGGTPTILAATGPTKIKADDGSTTAPEDQDAALLNKNGSVSSGPVKIVSSQEQPADLGQLPKSDLADGARPLPQPSPSPFPEPKKVKTFLVHPDGTMLSGEPVPSGTAPMTLAPSPAPLPATPKTASRGGATPAASSAVPSIASLAADSAPTDSTPAPAPPTKPARQAAAPGVKVASAKPTDTADAPASAGGYGVQLASSPNEADANAAFAKLKKKYPSQLGAYTATVHKAETGDKPVYRVRIGGMGQDEAKTLCSQLQTAGGSCFVMHN